MLRIYSMKGLFTKNKVILEKLKHRLVVQFWIII